MKTGHLPRRNQGKHSNSGEMLTHLGLQLIQFISYRTAGIEHPPTPPLQPVPQSNNNLE